MNSDRSCHKLHSEETPYYMAIYLHQLCMAADRIATDYFEDMQSETGLGGLLMVIKERAEALSLELDHSMFCEKWRETRAAIDCSPASIQREA